MEEIEMEEFDPVELDTETIRKWYYDASNEISNICGLQFPKFPENLIESDAVFNEKLNIEHALGEVYYPCAGGDTETIVDLFKEYSTKISLSTTRFGNHFIEHVGNANLDNVGVKPIKRESYLSYKQDGIVTLLSDIDKLAIFFHRSDSPGEGGSNQWWLKEVLFPVVLSKLCNRGLIVTDGCLCGYFDDCIDDVYVPWNAMCGTKPYSKPEIGFSFSWLNFRFTCVAGPFHRNTRQEPRTFVWQVDNIT